MQWVEFEKREGMGTNQFLFIPALSTVLGEEVQAVRRKFMDRDLPLPAGHTDDAKKNTEIAPRKEWGRDRNRLW